MHRSTSSGLSGARRPLASVYQNPFL